jgi:hypothetical protein
MIFQRAGVSKKKQMMPRMITQQMYTEKTKLERRIRNLLLIFIAGLVFSGITAFPLERELDLARRLLANLPWDSALTTWINFVHEGVSETNLRYTFIAYGNEWLAFAHLLIAVLFIGPLRDPVRNVWVIEFGMIACLGIFPLALIAGEIRGIPFFWRVFDCLFGVVGGLVLFACYRDIVKMES